MTKKAPELGLKGDGVERKEIEALNDAAEDYRRKRDKRMQETPKEKEAKTKLIALMESHKLKHYSYEDAQGVVQDVDLVEVAASVKVKKHDGDE